MTYTVTNLEMCVTFFAFFNKNRCKKSNFRQTTFTNDSIDYPGINLP